jgi:hypothetical protein
MKTRTNPTQEQEYYDNVLNKINRHIGEIEMIICEERNRATSENPIPAMTAHIFNLITSALIELSKQRANAQVQ